MEVGVEALKRVTGQRAHRDTAAQVQQLQAQTGLGQEDHCLVADQVTAGQVQAGQGAVTLLRQRDDGRVRQFQTSRHIQTSNHCYVSVEKSNNNNSNNNNASHD